MQRQTAWLNGDAFPDLGAFMRAARRGDAGRRCVICGAEQPDDLKWPAYALEMVSNGGGPVVECEYRACPPCEPRLDTLLDRLGAAPEKIR